MSEAAFDRARMLREASSLKGKRAWKRALALYEDLLAFEMNDFELHRAAAPVFARCGRVSEAWLSFRVAAEGLSAQGVVEKAIGVYREAASYLPHETATWEAIADLQLDRGRRSDAVAVLIEGRAAQRRRRHRAEAIQLLRRALDLAPENFRATEDLAWLLAASGSRPEAVAALDRLLPISSRRRRVRIRWIQLRILADWSHLALWLRAVFLGR